MFGAAESTFEDLEGKSRRMRSWARRPAVQAHANWHSARAAAYRLIDCLFSKEIASL